MSSEDIPHHANSSGEETAQAAGVQVLPLVVGSQSTPGTLLSIISGPPFLQRGRTCCNMTFQTLGKIQDFEMFHSKVGRESQNCSPSSNP